MKKESEKQKQPQKLSLWQKFLNLLFSTNTSPEAVTKKKLKEIAKSLSKTRYGKWYKASGMEIKPAMADFFYTIYKVIGPSKAVLVNANSSKVLKSITVECFLSEGQLKTVQGITDKAIEERSGNTDIDSLVTQVKKELSTFVGDFNTGQVQKADLIYEHIDAFINFVLFDFYFFLRKFDPAIIENNFNYTPNFQVVRGEYVIDSLKDFATVLYSLPQEVNWKDVFDVLEKYKNVKLVNEAQWKKVFNTLQDIKRARVMELLICHISSDPFYRVKTEPFTEKITDNYIANVKKVTNLALDKLIQKQKSGKAAVLVKKIFGDTITSGMKNYTVVSNEIFKKRGIDGFVHAEALNYLKAFLLDYVKADIRELSDLLLVRGNWGTQSITQDYSNSYHAIMQLATKIVDFDEQFKPGSDLSVKFRTLLSRMEREKEAARQLQKLLDTVNDAAFKIISMTVKHIVVIGNNFKDVLADYDKTTNDLIHNWKEIEKYAERPIKPWLVEAYKKIYDFIMLMKVMVKTL